MTRPNQRMLGVEWKHEANGNARSRRGAPARTLWPLALVWSREDDILNASPKPGVVQRSRMVGAEGRRGGGDPSSPAGVQVRGQQQPGSTLFLQEQLSVALPCYFLADAGPQSRGRGWKSEDSTRVVYEDPMNALEY
ncbi:hypothetical protein HYALB_00004454 [Hymenoscyphus albidus]|uniref:Uncharacterized protein n=1 Tax=Hymenoscyphus albidus TaxID=595503 RepID=A0A9N9LGT0_9HELO|nr:hypothetical protein HYALB_00004454 [Hymenoscyphus albidus]